jgi:hypothetical protein
MTSPHTRQQDDKQKEQPNRAEEDSDTITASIVRSLGGDEAADIFKDIFGDWF